jgi:tripartite-type tricarboxylate transporter receptor subunit TctC
MLLGFGVSAMKRREFITLLGGVAAVAWDFHFEAQAQQFPTQPIRLILGFAPGGITDFTGRVVAQRLSTILGGNPVVAENRPGAAGINAAAAVAHSRADGYTLILIDSGTVVNPMLRNDARYRMSDFTMVGMVGSSPVVIVASNHLAVKSIEELIDYGTKNPDKLSFATAGIGGAPHLAAKLFESRTGMKAIHVPYPGIAGAFGDLMAGNIQLAFSSIVGALPLTSENKIRALATTGSRRPAAYPDIPTLAETVLPGFNVDIWLGLAAPKGTPEPVIEQLNVALRQALKAREVVESLAKVGIEAWPTTVVEANSFVEGEGKRWPAVIEAAGLGPK